MWVNINFICYHTTSWIPFNMPKYISGSALWTCWSGNVNVDDGSGTRGIGGGSKEHVSEEHDDSLKNMSK